jgi:hypothetical protein
MVMFSVGDDAGHCSNGLTAQKFREAAPQERMTNWKWLRGIFFVFCTLLFVSGIAMATYFDTGRTRFLNVVAIR